MFSKSATLNLKEGYASFYIVNLDFFVFKIRMANTL